MKRIGLVAWATGENSFGATKPYLNWLGQFGKVELLLPSTGMTEGLDLLVLPGGADITPQSYGEVPGYYTGNPDVYKQYFYDNNLRQYIDAGTKIIGICLGFQQLCALYGGKLVQDYPFAYSSKHRAEFVDTLTFEAMYADGSDYKVNSLHHQGCFSLPEECTVIARSQNKNIEIAKFTENIYGFQYHPEEINDGIANEIVNLLLSQNEEV